MDPKSNLDLKEPAQGEARPSVTARLKDWKMGLVGIGLFFFLVLLIMVLESRKPPIIEAIEYRKDIKGSAFINANLALIENMRKDWLPNDKFWPTVFLDNKPNFQLGQLEVVRYNLRVLRDRLTRMRSTDKLDPNAEKAFSAISNDPKKWWFPSAESKWKEAGSYLRAYLKGLEEGTSYFYPRADNLAELFQDLSSLMGGVNTRLLNAIKEEEPTKTLEEENKDTEPKEEIDIPWHQVDDNFYYAQGISHALYATMLAIKIDFMDVLIKKNCMKLLDGILDDLRKCYFEPLIIFNGSRDSIFANHSLNLSSVFSDARQKMEHIVITLTRG